MRDVRYWFAWLPIILVFHGIEELLFGLDELYELPRRRDAADS